MPSLSPFYDKIMNNGKTAHLIWKRMIQWKKKIAHPVIPRRKIMKQKGKKLTMRRRGKETEEKQERHSSLTLEYPGTSSSSFILNKFPSTQRRDTCESNSSSSGMLLMERQFSSKRRVLRRGQAAMEGDIVEI